MFAILQKNGWSGDFPFIPHEWNQKIARLLIALGGVLLTLMSVVFFRTALRRRSSDGDDDATRYSWNPHCQSMGDPEGSGGPRARRRAAALRVSGKCLETECTRSRAQQREMPEDARNRGRVAVVEPSPEVDFV